MKRIFLTVFLLVIFWSHHAFCNTINLSVESSIATLEENPGWESAYPDVPIGTLFNSIWHYGDDLTIVADENNIISGNNPSGVYGKANIAGTIYETDTALQSMIHVNTTDNSIHFRSQLPDSQGLTTNAEYRLALNLSGDDDFISTFLDTLQLDLDHFTNGKVVIKYYDDNHDSADTASLSADITAISTGPQYTMADYFPMDAGNMWIFNRGEVFVTTGQTYNFEFYQGTRFIEKREEEDLYYYNGDDGILLVGVIDYDDEEVVDVSHSPIKIANAAMCVGESVSSSVSAFSAVMVSTLDAVETVTVPAGTFADALRFRIDVSGCDEDDEGDYCAYTELIWFAKNVGPVKIERVEEMPVNHSGCILTCGTFDWDQDIVEERVLNLVDYLTERELTAIKKRVVVVPLF